jgi:hypothetical protein
VDALVARVHLPEFLARIQQDEQRVRVHCMNSLVQQLLRGGGGTYVSQ